MSGMVSSVCRRCMCVYESCLCLYDSSPPHGMDNSRPLPARTKAEELERMHFQAQQRAGLWPETKKGLPADYPDVICTGCGSEFDVEDWIDCKKCDRCHFCCKCRDCRAEDAPPAKIPRRDCLVEEGPQAKNPPRRDDLAEDAPQAQIPPSAALERRDQ